MVCYYRGWLGVGGKVVVGGCLAVILDLQGSAYTANSVEIVRGVALRRIFEMCFVLETVVGIGGVNTEPTVRGWGR